MKKLTLEEKKAYAESRGYTLLNEDNFTTKDTALVKDSQGYEYLILWAEFHRQGATPTRTTLDTKRRQAKERGYTLLAEENPKIDSKVSLRNDATGYIYKVRLSDFLYKGSREKVGSSMSKGEAYIYAFLEANLREGYSFTYQEKVKYSKDKFGLFDFSIKGNGSIVAFIEFNGIQHYEVSPLFGEAHFKLTQESDKLKQEYADNEGIPLLWIPYTDNEMHKTIQKTFPTFILDELNSFEPTVMVNSHTSLEEKKEIAKRRGYLLDITDNFVVTDKVKLVHIETGEEWEPRWADFIGGVNRSKKMADENKRQSSLEDKKKIAEALGYALMEIENFSVKKNVKLKDTKGNIITRRFQTIEQKYRNKKGD